ncbi:T-cell-specific guanine nucleotide triphosphate-binding protein 1-like [Lingula anatina]|uniref:T-cell-specific guanine nucleotide triphosphate-binding protein 1-like n=1 Tax=Lingula anatina TaxID=7574 RepID=A0A1S3H9H8_LINAN|nr:T-cell-specific guanine nucleotide triphosphate-binding protein 1-like [Lingula anatina]|eukprot:XP_013381784.1 T-cell-specific guanine nucleotide triphosphate-binding protein 1-like [Lingula anatina]
MSFDEKYIEETKKIAEQHGLEALVSHLQKNLTESENVKVNIAVTGISGSGKSSFINTIRGLTPSHEGAADVDCVETTKKPTPYPFPFDENVKIWDLPGLGTPGFTQKNYVRRAELDDYDFFLILTQKRFTNDGLWLANRVKDMGKNFFFVRTHFDNDLANSERNFPGRYKEHELLEKIKENVKKHVDGEQTSQQVEKPEYVYVISTNFDDTKKWEYGKLVADMKEALPDVKRQVLTLALWDLSEASIKEKSAVWRSLIWPGALAYGAIGAVQAVVPGLRSFDMPTLAKIENRFRKSFGLDDASLERLSKRNGVPLGKLLSLAKGCFDMSSCKTIEELILMYAGAGAEIAFSPGSPMVPVVAGSASFGMALFVLPKILDRMERVAIDVIKAALEFENN